MNTMAAAVFDGELRYVRDVPLPEPKPGWGRIGVRMAGICKTDMEIMRGYLGYRGILGHEFVGFVDRCADSALIGRRVVGEINAACGECAWCVRGLGRHCPNRTTLGIAGLDGCMAEFCLLPEKNLLVVPDTIPDERAVLTEPLSAACEILEQLTIRGNERIVVLGDGRLGILCAWALATAASDVTIVGHHPEKLSLAKWRGITATTNIGEIKPGADIVVEATGSGEGIVAAMQLCRPRGTIVLKSTVALPGNVNLAPVVIDEQTIVGSRCGRFGDGLAMMQRFPDMPLERLITGRYPLARVEEAFRRAQQKDAVKILLEVASR
jgi:alcohol dehydrogenase